jgi:raffinose/stachyose/melibiose transport system substrate-binding protein
MKKKLVSLIVSAAMVSTMLVGCGSTTAGTSSSAAGQTASAAKTETASSEAAKSTAASATEAAAASTKAASGSGAVYYLNFKPEQDKQWQDLAAKYSKEKGVPVTVVTAASGTYDQTLKSEMAKTQAPTLFQVNGPVGLASWKDYCYNLKDSDVYKQLKSDDFALKGDSGEIDAVAYVIETYGIIYNKTLLQKYCKMDGAVIKDASEITSFATMKKVADDIQAKKDKLGVEGAFTSAGMDSSSDWRFKTHLANLPIYYEYKDNNETSTDAIKGTYLNNYKNVWDLYITDSTCDKKLLSSKTGDDASSEFATGEAVFYQNGTWAYSDIMNDGLKDEDLGMLPIYIGAPGEEKQGLCTGSENYWCVNKKASPADIKATLDFLSWVITSDEGRDSLANSMEFTTPFKSFDNGYASKNPFVKIANDYIAQGKSSVGWVFDTIPSETWKNNVGSALLEYAQGTGKWDGVKTAFVDGWAKEYKAAHASG